MPNLCSLEARLILLALAPVVLVIALSSFLVDRGNRKMIKLQAEALADTVSTQVRTVRKQYVNSVVAKVRGSDFAAREGAAKEDSHVPLPATFVMNVGEDI